ncbi:hypothetical protein BGZ76_010366 [Entomortierella beljakovae]|nr:hypothetical protein BGZ76_010366 [Entomortierella beljakovae]
MQRNPFISQPGISPYGKRNVEDPVGQYLSDKDLYACSRTNKAWNHWAAPLLWIQPMLNFPPKEAQFQALRRYAPHVKFLPQHTEPLISRMIQIPFPNLKFLQFDFSDSNAKALHVSALRFAQSLQSLQILGIGFASYTTEIHEQLIRTLKTSKSLEEFELATSKPVDMLQIVDVFEACSQLKTLQLFIERGPGNTGKEPSNRLNKLPTLIGRFDNLKPTKIRKLGAEFSIINDETVVFLNMIKKCPLLETLIMRKVRNGEFLRDLTEVFQANTCPKLNEIELTDLKEARVTDQDLEVFITACGKASVDQVGVGGELYWPGLKSITLGDYADKQGSTLMAISFTQKHTLTRLIWSDPFASTLHFAELLIVMGELVHLEVLKARVLIEDQNVDTLDWEHREDWEEMMTTPWRCRGLTELELHFELTLKRKTVLDDSWKRTMGHRSLALIFKNLGLQSRLKDLILRETVDLLSLSEKGPKYLASMSGLKQLRSLEFSRYILRNMGSVEAKWMIANWPRITHVWTAEFGTRGQTGGSEFPDTLLKLRPWMTVEKAAVPI